MHIVLASAIDSTNSCIEFAIAIKQRFSFIKQNANHSNTTIQRIDYTQNAFASAFISYSLPLQLQTNSI